MPPELFLAFVYMLALIVLWTLRTLQVDEWLKTYTGKLFLAGCLIEHLYLLFTDPLRFGWRFLKAVWFRGGCVARHVRGLLK